VPGATEAHVAGLRERKKQRTRWALVDAALDLFSAQGYEATTIDEIVAAVDVSQRTYFRYFASKEDVALSFLVEYDDLFVAALAERPAEEPPVPAMRAAIDVSLDAMLASDEAHAARFRKLYRLIESTAALTAGNLRRYAATEEAAAVVIASRMGAVLPSDARPYLLVASFLTVVRVAFEGCVRDEVIEPSEIVPRVRALIELAVDTLPAAWSAQADGTNAGS
jgi:AcrR family transcriptional regulator